MCGEKADITGHNIVCRGSPPRMRGKAVRVVALELRIGITPAYAGKSIGGSDANKCPWDHPRVCGEKKDNPDEWSEVQGSPPRMRGKAGLVQIVGRLRGITPAYAGKRVRRSSTHPGSKDHPRVCGEKLADQTVSKLYSGSPPRMRGKGCPSTRSDVDGGITPAYAGKSIQLGHRTSWQEDHPRVCGEKASNSGTMLRTMGSPPRMRGKD